MIRIENLVHQYTVWESETEKSKKTVLDGISVDIPSGQFLAILGPNGCGKSTLAKHLNVLLLPAEGTVWIDGKNTADVEKLWQIRKEVGMVFQNPDNQIIGTSVEEDIAFGPENHMVPSEEIRERVTFSLNAVNLLHKRKVSPSRLSGGQKQRVAVAGTIAANASCIVLDEPTAMLDPQGRREVISTVTGLCREKGMTVVLITHHMDECIDADRLVIMSNGRIVADGCPCKVFADVALMEREGLDVPETTRLLYELNRQGFSLPLEALCAENCAEEIAKAIRG